VKSETTYYSRNLPHYQPVEALYSVVFRLGGSLPIETILRLREERTKRENRIKNSDKKKVKEYLTTLQEEYFYKFDSLLDCSTTGPKWLHDDAVAKITADAIHFLDGERYTLVVYTIMPNHVHLVVALDGKQAAEILSEKIPYALARILHSLKRHTALESNRVLHRKGEFWQHESYDHIVRDSGELKRIVEYIISNPVTAKLVQRWEDWKWTYVNNVWLEKNL
jgi:putative transposase